MYNDHFLSKKLQERQQGNYLRQLTQVKGLIDFSSNDYLGIKTGGHLQSFFTGAESHGSGGARTLSGNYPLIEEVEKSIASFHTAEAALLFNSGYCANLGVMSSIPQRGDTILYDYLAHASLRDGIRLSRAEAFSFRHNDLEDLTCRLQKTKGTTFVVTESVFSMDGDTAPLNEMVHLCDQYGAHLIVDEAHATGIIGERGEGLVQHLDLSDKVFARIHTFGKALGIHGAAVVGSARLKSYLINFARSFIFTTALPESAVNAIKATYTVFPHMHSERNKLRQLVQCFNEINLPFEKLPGETPIKAVIIPGNNPVKRVTHFLQENGWDVRPVLYPSVPKGRERLRINLHAFNTIGQVQSLLQLLDTCDRTISL
jgi:8-amino-7-oxononanoate synthase